MSLTTPKELGGPGGNGANPEKLFAAGHAACFLGAMKFVVSQGGPKVRSGSSICWRRCGASGHRHGTN